MADASPGRSGGHIDEKTLQMPSSADETVRVDPGTATVETVHKSAGGDPATVDTVQSAGVDPNEVTLKAAPDATHATSISETPQLPEEIGGVKIIRMLGVGGMGEVYLGRHETLDLEVAVKLVKVGRDDRERFLQEARTAVRIQHDNVVRVYNAGEEDGRMYLILELVTGGDASELVKREGKLDWRQAVELAIQAADGLGAAHKAGIVHRDVKPANFMLTAEGTLKVADLGLAKQQEGDTSLTQTGTLMGTPAYMAPEQIMDTRTAGPPADIYSLGVSLYQFLSGELPFHGETTTQMILAHLNEPVPELRKLVSNVPSAIVQALYQMLDKKPENRPADGMAAALMLREALASAVSVDEPTPISNDAITAPEIHSDKSANNKLPLIAGGVLALIAVIVAIVIGLKDDTASPAPAASGTNETAAVPATRKAGEPAADPPPAVVPVDAWQTPPRAAFLLETGLDGRQIVAIENAIRDRGLVPIERARINALVQEQQLIKDGIVDVQTAVKTGKLVGGHIAFFAEKDAVRCVIVETGVIAGSAILADGDIKEQIPDLLQKAVDLVDTCGRLSEDVLDGTVISVGAKHGVTAGDVFRVFADEAGQPGKTVAKATVTAVKADTAVVTVQPAVTSGFVKREIPALP